MKPKTNREREYTLEAIEDWRSGAKGTVGCPSGTLGGQYELVMRLEIKRLLGRLREIDLELGNAMPEEVYR